MLILGIETSTTQVGCAIGGHEGVLASAHSLRARRHAESLAPQIDFVRRQARIELSEVGVVAIDVGPGLYTGLRVGISTALAMAHALAVPMIGVSSLDLLAHPMRFSNRLVAAALDARRGELFYALYRQVPGGIQRLSEPKVGVPAQLSSELLAVGDEILLVGDGALRYREEFETNHRIEIAERGLAHPSAASLVQLAHARALREDFVNPWELQPLYLRRPDAQVNWSTREQR